MNDISTGLIAVLGIIILIFVIAYFTIKELKKRKNQRIGKNGEKRVKHALQKIAKKYHCKLINDLYLPLYDKTTQVDHILIGSFGIVAVETKALNGEVYGNDHDKEWTHIIGDNKHKFYNPLHQNKTHVDCIHHILEKSKLYRVNIDSLVVFAGNKIELFIPKGLPVITLDLVKSYFKKSRYKQDNGVDVEKVYETLLASQVTDRELLKKHNDNVKKMAKSNR